ncbi:MAG: hypothetical protein H0T62_02435 [Parachlamydiaceae bacterium]|nr:hypothetical protein [Parachlamydiaceae bacterium]
MDIKFNTKPIFEILKDCLCYFSNLKQLTLIPKKMDLVDDLATNASHQIDHEMAIRDLANFARTKNILIDVDLSELETHYRMEEVFTNHVSEEERELAEITLKVALEGIQKAVSQK